MRMSEIFTQHKKLLAGESFMVDWLPGQGAIVTVKGQPQGEAFKEPEFFNALLGIWLGPGPPISSSRKRCWARLADSLEQLAVIVGQRNSAPCTCSL
jgi:hypothetical protein